MTKNYKSPLGLWPRLFITLCLFFLCASSGYAQRTDSFEQGKLRIKVSEQLAQQLEHATITANANRVVSTGIQSIDNISQQFKVNSINRVFRPAGKFEARHRRYGLHLWYEIRMDKAASVLQAMGAFKQLNLVEKTEPVFKKAIIGSENKDYGPRIVPTPLQPFTLAGASNDPFIGNQWHYNNTGQTGGTIGSDIKLFQAWAIETGKPQVIVAVTDGGIQVNHPDIAANIWINTDEIPGNGVDDDNNGYVDDINGYGFGDNTGTIAPDPHGTHTSGTIGAVTNNGVGVAGIAGGSGTGDGVRLMSCAAFGANDSGGFAETYVYGADNGAVISQNSWGYTSPDVFEQAVLDGIDYFIAEAGKDDGGNQIGPMKGGIVIFAAGNDGTDAHHYPGFYAPTLSVSGTNHMDKKAWYSNYGGWVDIAAPGGETNTVSQQGVLSTLSNSQYGFFQGTSMATPHVSGVAALIVSSFGGPGLTPDMVRGRLVQTTDDIDVLNPDFIGLLGSGRLNAFSALQQNDHVAPDSITNLAAVSSEITSITLAWTSPHDSGNGSASSYSIRYSLVPLNESNFDSATAVVNPPAPGIAGSIESYTVAGLAPGTGYYFAIKAIDFFGNASAISNVIQKSTEFPPVISVSPLFISDTLQTAQNSTKSFTISNIGQGPLLYSISDDGSFVHASASSDTIQQGQSKSISLLLNANNLLAGDYTSIVTIFSNDPLHDSTFVTVALHVINNGFPIATVSPDSSIYFGGVFVGGSLNSNINVHNSGSETLKTWLTSLDGADFSSSLTDTISIAPFGNTTINVRFTASSLGVSSGVINLATNDPVNPSYAISLTGVGLEAPAIVVSPDSLIESLHTGRTATQQLTIQNTGGSDLIFSVKVTPKTTNALTTTQISLPKKQASVNSANLKQSNGKRISPANLQIKSVSQSSVSKRVLIVTPDSDVDDLKSILNSFGDIQAKAFPVDSLPVISLSSLSGYDIVMTTNNGQWQASGNVAPEVIGDLLADYIDQGGKVIVNQFAYSYDAWKMAGRFIDGQYGPFTPSTTDANVDVTLDSISSTHPIMQGVSTLDYSGFVQNVGLASGAIKLGAWSSGDIFAAANDNVVALNLLPSLGNGDGLQWSGDLPTFYQNAIHWLSGPSFIKVQPKKGVISAGSQASLDVIFSASSLASGSYEATLDITNNVPGNELISVPARLNVLGPEFSVTPDSLSAVLGKDETSTQTIILTNNGSDSQPYSVRIQDKNGSNARLTSLKAVPVSSSTASGRVASVNKRTESYNGPSLKEGNQAIQTSSPSGRSKARASDIQNSSVEYSTDFESFDLGDIDGQQTWEGQYGNWAIDTSNPQSGSKHIRSVADGLGQTLAFSPLAAIGVEGKSTATMKVNVQGSGVTWQVIPQSPTAGFLNTRVEFSPDGSASALVSDGAGGGSYQPINAVVPSGYFDLTIEVNRDSATFNIYFNNDNVFHGLGFAGDIEQVVLLSLMEEEGPIFDIDDLQILDGARDTKPGYLTITPVTGNIGSGESIALTATFNTAGLEFGKYQADINIDILNLDKLVVPTLLHVVGDPAIEVDPTVLQAVVGYKEDTVKNFAIKNTGGNDLTYRLTVIGASTDMTKLPIGPINKFAVSQSNTKVQQKISKDKTMSKVVEARQLPITLLAGTSLLEEGFDSFPPTGWSSSDNAGAGVTWNLASAWGEGNYSGLGDAATVSSDAFGLGEFDTELTSPSISIGAYRNIVVQYSANYQNYANLDFLDLDIKVDGTSWVNVLSWNEDHGSFRGTPGEFVSVSLDSYLAGAGSFQLRWHYYDPNTDDFDWYAQIDNVVVLGDPKAWLTVSPSSGSVPVGGTANIDAHYYAQDLDPGFYVAGILVNSNAANTPLVGVVASLQVLNPAAIEVSPSSITQELFKGQTASQTVLISNHGESELKFTIDGIAIQGSLGKQDRKEPLIKRVTPSQLKTDMNGSAAIVREKRTSSTDLYATGFEEFATGDISGQEDWSAQFGNWTVEETNPYGGAQHFRGFSDGLGQSIAFSPQVAIGTNPISSTTMRVNLSDATGSTWQVIPQSPSVQLVNTRIQISPDGSVQALVADTLGGGAFYNINAPVPTGYFELKIEIERATAVFSVYYDNAKVFEGQGFAGDIEEIVILSSMEADGPVLDIDNLAILDGTPQAPWIVVSPTSGVVPSNSSLPVTVYFDAHDLSAGSYTDTLRIHSNDPLMASVNVPVLLHVTENLPPVIAAISDTTVVEGQSIVLTFTATDPDDSLVDVSLITGASFVTLKSKTDNSASYSVKPLMGDAGDYSMIVFAKDGRGGFDSIGFNLQVLPYGIKNFSLVNIATKEVISSFDDSVTVNIARSDFSNIVVRANTNPAKVGSVSFKMDGVKQNSENIAPYDLKKSVFQSLNTGSHWLYADAFTKTNGKGVQGTGRGVVINIVSSSLITRFDIVNITGAVLKELHDNDVINIGNTVFKKITIVAHVNDSKVGSVVFKLNDVKKIENIAPYSFNGDNNGIYKAWPFAPGLYTLEGTPYSKAQGNGKAGETKSLSFWVVNTDTFAISASSRNGIESTTLLAEEVSELSLYPVPTSDELQISLPSTEDIAEVRIMNTTGMSIYKSPNLGGKKHITISTSKIGLVSGIYFVQAISVNGKRYVKKFIRE